MQAVQAAAVARGQAAWMSERVHEPGRVPALPATPYLLVSVDGGRAESLRGCGMHGSDAYRLVVMAVGASMAELTFAVGKAREAFRDVPISASVTPCVLESSGPVVRDDDDPDRSLSMTLVFAFSNFQEA